MKSRVCGGGRHCSVILLCEDAQAKSIETPSDGRYLRTVQRHFSIYMSSRPRINLIWHFFIINSQQTLDWQFYSNVIFVLLVRMRSLWFLNVCELREFCCCFYLLFFFVFKLQLNDIMIRAKLGMWAIYFIIDSVCSVSIIVKFDSIIAITWHR